MLLGKWGGEGVKEKSLIADPYRKEYLECIIMLDSSVFVVIACIIFKKNESDWKSHER